MPVSFLNPALLFGGLAAALPVIIHFLSRKKVQRRKFSDMRFLNEVQARQARSLGLRRWLLLLLRVLAILALVAAVAGPRWGGLTAGAGARSLIFVIDTSASMKTQQEEGTRFDQAVADVRRMIESLPEETSVQVLNAGSRTSPLFGQWLPAGAGALTGLASIQPTDGSFDLPAVVLEVSRLVARAPTQPVDVVLVSDFQENPLSGPLLSDLTAAVSRLQDSGQARWITRPVGQAIAGGGIQGITLPGRALQRSENAEIQALVTSHLPEQVFTLEIDGYQVAEAVLEEASQTPVPLVFSLSVPGPGLHVGKVRKTSDAFAQDDERPFVLSVPREISVLLVHGADRPVDPLAGRGGWRYLAEALSPGQGESLFLVQSVESTQLTSGDLAASQVVVFIDPDPLGRTATNSLKLWLQAGGTAAFLMGEPTASAYLESSLLPLLEMESSVASVLRPANQSLRARVVDPGHPIFSGLEADAIQTFEDVPWWRWFQLAAGSQSVLLEMGDESPLMISGTLDQGRFVLLPFNLLPSSSQLAASPMALPFFQRLVAWMATGELQAAAVNMDVGQRAAIKPLPGVLTQGLEGTENLLILGDGTLEGGVADLIWQGQSPRLVGDVLDNRGLVTFTSGSDTLGMVAARLPANESTVGLYSPEDWVRQASLHGLEVRFQLTGQRVSQLTETLNGRDLAPWFFALAFLLLLTELFVGRGLAGPREASG